MNQLTQTILSRSRLLLALMLECLEWHGMGTGSLVPASEAGEGIREKQIAALLKRAFAPHSGVCAVAWPGCAPVCAAGGSQGLRCSGAFFACVISVLLLK